MFPFKKSTVLLKCSLCEKLMPIGGLLPRRFISQQKQKLFRVLHEDEVDRKEGGFQKNLEYNRELSEKLKQLVNLAVDGGGEKNRVKHTKVNKKLLVTDRLKELFDDPDDVLEIGMLYGMGMPYGNVPRAGAITAIGKIHGIHCIVNANDATVKGGTIYPIGLRKTLRASEIAKVNRLPAVYVTDSGGAFLPLQADIFTLGGRVFYDEAILNSLGIPQLCIVVGSCTAGGAYIPTMSQEAVIVDKVGHIFLGGPPLVYAALGEKVSPDELGGGVLHSSVSGCVDYYSVTEAEAFAAGRDSIATFNVPQFQEPTDFDEPLYDMEDMYGLIPAQANHLLDMYKVISRLVDGSRFHEFRKRFGTTLITGFAYLQGYLIGIVANNGPLTETACVKGSHFIQLCDQRQIPLLFLHNSHPDSSLMNFYKDDMDGLARTTKDLAKLMHSVACAGVPKISLVVGNSYGASNYAMCGRSFEPRFMFSWPNGQICLDDPHDIVQQFSEYAASEAESDIEKLREKLTEQSSAFYAASHGWDDGCITPSESRKVLGRCLTIIHQGQSWEGSQVNRGVMRM